MQHPNSNLIDVDFPSGTLTLDKVSETYRALVMGCLLDPGADDATGFEIRVRPEGTDEFGTRVVGFTTGGVNGRSARDTAEGNLLHLSEWRCADGYEFVLYTGALLPTYANGAVAIAAAQHGIGRTLDAQPIVTEVADGRGGWVPSTQHGEAVSA